MRISRTVEVGEAVAVGEAEAVVAVEAVEAEAISMLIVILTLTLRISPKRIRTSLSVLV